MHKPYSSIQRILSFAFAVLICFTSLITPTSAASYGVGYADPGGDDFFWWDDGNSSSFWNEDDWQDETQSGSSASEGEDRDPAAEKEPSTPSDTGTAVGDNVVIDLEVPEPGDVPLSLGASGSYSFNIPRVGSNSRARAAANANLVMDKYDQYRYYFSGMDSEYAWWYFYLDGRLVYCIEPYNLNSSGGKLYATQRNWNGLTIDQARYVGYILHYGATTHTNAGNHMATQALLWEVVLGYRDDNFNRTSTTVYNGTVGRYESMAKPYYDDIATKVMNHAKIPSFAQRVASSAPQYLLQNDGGSTYSHTETDTRGVISQFNITAPSGVTVTTNGNMVTFQSNREIDPAETVKMVKQGTERDGSSTLLFWLEDDSGNPSNPEQVKVGSDGAPDPVEAYVKVATSGTPPDTGEFKLIITKYVEGTNELLPGATFRVEHTSHGVLGNFTTNSQGKIEIEVPWAGTYIVTEISAPAGYVLPADPDDTVYVDKDNPIGYFTFFNAPYTSVIVAKEDAVTGELLPGATIKIHNISTGYETSGTTGSNGTVTFSNMEPGSYYVEEIVAPEGYVLNTQRYTVELESNKVARVSIPNQPYTGVEITKKDANTGQLLAGADFKIIHISTGIEYTVTSDANGIAFLGNVPPGDYEVREIKAPNGYIISDEVQTVNLQSGKVAKLTFYDWRKPGLIIKKVDPDGGPVAGAVFELRRGSGQVLIRETTDQNGIIYRGELTTDTYVIEEVQAPVGYELDPNNPQSIFIDAEDDNKEFVVTFVNQCKPSLKIAKADADDPNVYLPGALFRISEQGGSKTWDIRTGPDGTATLTNLEIGVAYLVEEIEAPPGYVNSGWSEVIVLRENDIHTIIVPNKREPSITIVKKDLDTGILLFGATFRIAYQGSTQFQDVTTDLSGKATLKGMSPGWYTITEIRAPDSYLLLDEPVVREVKEGEDLVIELFNRKKPSMKLVKLDSLTHERLPGATFEIWLKTDTGQTLVGRRITDENGEIDLTEIEPGRYEIREVEAPDGYNIDTEVKEITLEYGKEEVVYFTNTAKQPIFIRKVDQDGNPLRGAQFVIKTINGELVKSVTTGLEGYAILPYADPGWYIVEEVRAPDGYIISTTPQTIELKSGKTAEVEFVNVKKPEITIIKRDSSDPSKVLAGARFKVTLTSGEYVGEYTSDSSGLVHLTNLEPGSYVVTEIAAPTGYILTMEPQIVELKEGETRVLEFFNAEKPGLLLKKLDKITMLPVGGATFNVVRLENSARVDLGSYTTDDNGTLFIPDLTPGHYVLTETRAPAGYMLDPTPVQVYVEEGKLNTFEIFNIPYSSLNLKKVSKEDPSKPLEGAVFKLYDEFRREIGSYETNALGEILIPELPAGTYFIQEVRAPAGYILDSTVRKIELIGGKTTILEMTNTKLGSLRILKRDEKTGKPLYSATFILYDAKNNIVAEVTTDQEGKIVFGSLEPGTYKLKEIKAPSGYVLDDTIRTITVREGETTEIVVDNTPETGRVQVIKVSSEDSTIRKVKKGDGLQGAVFEIFDEELNRVDTIRTDKRGYATSKDLPLGKYFMKEVKAPEFFFTDGKPIFFEVKRHDDLIRFVVENKPEDIEVDVQKRGVVECLPGDVIDYTFSQIMNKSNCSLDEFYWADDLPVDALRIESLNTGTWTQRVKFDVYIKTNQKSGWTKVKSGLQSNVEYTIDLRSTALGLAANEYVVSYKLVFGEVEEGFREDKQPFIRCRVLDTLPDGYRFTNRTEVGGRRGKEWVYQRDSWVTVIFRRKPLPKTGY